MANIVYKKDDKLIFQPYVIKEIGGIRVAILGLGYIQEEHPSSKLLKLLDPIIVAKKYIPILRDKSDIIIALTHIGIGADFLADETLIPINNKIKDDEDVTQLLKPYSDKLSEVLFTSKVAITKKEMGNLIAEAVRSQTGSDIAMLDIESVQNGIKEGDVTLAKIYAIHPWRNRLLMFELTGEQIKRALSEKDAIVSGFNYRNTKFL